MNSTTRKSTQERQGSTEKGSSQERPSSAKQIAQSPIEDSNLRNGNNPTPVVPNTPKRAGDGKAVPNLYAARTTQSKLAIAKKRGGSEATEQAVENALKWLAGVQEADGSWNPRRNEGGVERMVLGHNRQGAGANADTGITALAVLAFLAHGHTHLEGTYRETVQHGLEFLVRSQQANGDLAGRATFFARTYCHSMSMLAVSEALAITGDQRLKPAVQRAVNFTVRIQNPNDGGWRYRFGDSGDMSQFGWIVLALHSAELGGISVPQTTKQRMKAFLESCTSGAHKGLASYRPTERVSHSMTAEAFVCRNFIDEKVSSATSREAASKLLTELPSFNKNNLYYWYYGTLAMYNAGNDYWDQWNRALTDVLVRSQRTQGPLAGSWNPDGLWAGYGGRVYSTAMSTLCLEVYYRYLPMFEVAQENNAQTLRNAKRTRASNERADTVLIH